MANISFRLPDSIRQQVDEVRGNVARSKVIRVALVEWLEEHDEAPRWLKNTNKRDKLIEENNPIASAANFKQRTWEQTRRLLEDDEGNRRPFSPEPDKYKRAYVQSWLKEVHMVIPQMWTEEYMEHLDHLQNYYETVHPSVEVDTPKRTKDIVRQMAVHIKNGNSELAREMADNAESQEVLPPSKTSADLMADAKRESDKTWDELGVSQ